MDPQELKERMGRLKGEPATMAQVKYIVGLLAEHGITDEERHSIMMYLVNQESTKALNKAQASLLIEILLTDSSFDPHTLVRERLLELGQLELL